MFLYTQMYIQKQGKRVFLNASSNLTDKVKAYSYHSVLSILYWNFIYSF